ncbi:MAG TPA: hypothetical protein VE959_22355 [Bryobacteraceae bacterium]|nr:hypothetical protein [Bryobacteraceae bacterium]
MAQSWFAMNLPILSVPRVLMLMPANCIFSLAPRTLLEATIAAAKFAKTDVCFPSLTPVEECLSAVAPPASVPVKEMANLSSPGSTPPLRRQVQKWRASGHRCSFPAVALASRLAQFPRLQAQRHLLLWSLAHPSGARLDFGNGWLLIQTQTQLISQLEFTETAGRDREEKRLKPPSGNVGRTAGRVTGWAYA